jgi:hypothetical protein
MTESRAEILGAVVVPVLAGIPRFLKTSVGFLTDFCRVPDSALTFSVLGAEDEGMNLSFLGPWVALVAVPALVIAFVAAVALRGAQPEHRAEILKALAVLALALLARRPVEGPQPQQGSPPRKLPRGVL